MSARTSATPSAGGTATRWLWKPRTFRARSSSRALENLKVTERFKRVADDRLYYNFQVEDPTMWEKPWAANTNSIPSARRCSEYACHEGNHALPGILTGERMIEAEAAKAAAAKATKPAKGKGKN